jgi:hypothetical protein
MTYNFTEVLCICWCICLITVCFLFCFETYPASDITRDYSVFKSMSVFIALFIYPINKHTENVGHVAK